MWHCGSIKPDLHLLCANTIWSLAIISKRGIVHHATAIKCRFVCVSISEQKHITCRHAPLLITRPIFCPGRLCSDCACLLCLSGPTKMTCCEEGKRNRSRNNNEFLGKSMNWMPLSSADICWLGTKHGSGIEDMRFPKLKRLWGNWPQRFSLRKPCRL